jgi:hypothetical protein
MPQPSQQVLQLDGFSNFQTAKTSTAAVYAFNKDRHSLRRATPPTETESGHAKQADK